MQVPIGHVEEGGRFVPIDWRAIVSQWVAWGRFLRMALGAFLTTAMCVAAVGAWYLLAARNVEPARIMMTSGSVWPRS